MKYINDTCLIAEMKSRIIRHDIISFDIFDTLLLRPYVKPDDLFYHLERLNNEDGFAIQRIQADSIVRMNNPQHEEININQIYDALAEKYHYLKQQELDLEESILTANPEILEIYNYAKELGKQIIFVSDMYLPKAFIEKILEKNGYAGYFKLYLSSELNKTKRSLNLYKFVLDDLKIAPQKIFHIGDNKHSDYEAAKKMGLSAFHYEKIITRYLNYNPKALILYQSNQANIAASIILGINAIKSLNFNEDYWENLGYDCAGPVAYAYVEWLYHNFKEDKIEDVLFVARDGYTLKRIFDLIEDQEIKSHYFYAPRTFYSAITLFPSPKLNIEIDKFNAVEFILNYYRTKHPFLKENTPKITHSDEGIEFIKNNIDLYKDLALEEIKAYLNYIESENLGEGNIALIDVQSISLTSQTLVTNFILEQKTQGYYWRFPKAAVVEHQSFFCKAFQKDDNVNRNWSFMEFLLMAPENPIQGIEGCNPIYKKDISYYEKFRIDNYPCISNGALDFAKDVHKYFKGRKIFIDDKLIADLTNIFEQYPDSDDVNHLFDIQCGADPNHEIYCRMFRSWAELVPTN